MPTPRSPRSRTPRSAVTRSRPMTFVESITHWAHFDNPILPIVVICNKTVVIIDLHLHGTPVTIPYFRRRGMTEIRRH